MSVLFFLNPHGPLSFTSHCRSRSAFPPFRFVFLFLYPHSPSPVYGFPSFLFFFGPFSSLRFVPFSLFVFLFLCSFSSHLLALSAIFIGQRGAGASLLPPYSSAWGAGFAALPQHRVGWPMGWLARRGAPDFSPSRCLGFRVFCRAHDLQELMMKEEENSPPSPAACPGEGERRTVSLKTAPFYFFF